MKILLVAIGTRGDIEPFLAAGELLDRNAHEMVYAFPEQLCGLVPKQHRVHALDHRFLDLIDSPEGRVIMGGRMSFLEKMRAYKHLYSEGMKINERMVQQQMTITETEDPDLVVYHAKANFPPMWHLTTGKPIVLLSAVPYLIHATNNHPHLGFNLPGGKFFNRFSYTIANYGLLRTVRGATAKLPEQYRYSHAEFKRTLFSTKCGYTVSPSIFPRPQEWPDHVRVLGYHERDKQSDWQPTPALQQFLEKHEKILFLTFGSMINPRPKEVTHILLNELKRANIPTLVNTASGGLIVPEAYRNDPNFHFTERIPYDYIFPKMYAVVHHGGSGTTHTALKYGCATMILPHIIDQFMWNRMMATQGVGPLGIGISKITAENVQPLLRDLWNNPTYKARAEEIGRRMAREKIEAEFLQFIVGQEEGA